MRRTCYNTRIDLANNNYCITLCLGRNCFKKRTCLQYVLRNVDLYLWKYSVLLVYDFSYFSDSLIPNLMAYWQTKPSPRQPKIYLYNLVRITNWAVDIAIFKKIQMKYLIAISSPLFSQGYSACFHKEYLFAEDLKLTKGSCCLFRVPPTLPAS